MTDGIRIKRCAFCKNLTFESLCCSRCALKLKEYANDKIFKTDYCDGFTAPFINSEFIKTGIYHGKFDYDLSLIKAFLGFMSLCETYDVDVIVGVPRFKEKLNANNINISYELAKGLKRILKVRFERQAVIKIKRTEKQHNLGFAERATNLKSSFSVTKKYVEGKNVLIVDDMITTGATVNEIAKECKKSGAKNVYAIAIAVSKGLAST